MHAAGFPPVAAADARVLILGSLPGAVSLARQEYYAQPRNAFWPIMGALVGASPALPYVQRLDRLRAARIALWDVCASGFRPGSLDAAILRSSVVANDFFRFLSEHRQVEAIYFNGRTAAGLFARLVLPRLPEAHQVLRRVALPSTSPAHATMRFAGKLRQWSDALRDGGGTFAGAAL